MASPAILEAALPTAVSGFTTLALVKAWIRIAWRAGFTGRDMNKPGGPRVAEAGGVWSLVGIAFGLLALEAVYVYTRGSYYRVSEVFALVTILVLSGLLGFVDDIAGWKKGLPVWSRVAFMAPIAVPMAVIKAGVSRMELPLVGVVDFGVYYPLLVVPVGILGAANAFNMIAGYNGLEAGMALVITASTAAYAYLKGLQLTLQASLVALASIAAFLVFNAYPARVFPGNSFTYGFGAFYASLTVVDDFQKFGLALFTLYFLELVLFLRGLLHGVYKENFARLDGSGGLHPPYDRVYSVTHVALVVIDKLRGGRGAREVEVVAFILALQAVVSLAALALMA